MSIELKNAAGPTIVGSPVLKTTDIETINLKVSGLDTSVSLASLAMTDATKFESLVVTGDKALTVSALNANVTSINASGMTTGGSFIQSGRSQTTAANYVGSLGNDTFRMAHGNDVIDGAAGTGDTLVVTGNYILGGIQVDLGATGDQVTTFNGSANAAIQSGFENIDFSAITGSAQADITAVKTGSTIIGTRNADQITGGAGADAITMGVSGVALAFDAINAAAGTDNLVIVGTLTTSTTESQNVIDLSSTSDQIGTINNATESTIQIGFENVDLSGLTVTSGGGITITAAAGGSTIVGTGDTDVINAGAGVDTITGGAGADLYKFAAGSSSSTAIDSIVGYATTEQITFGATNVTANSSAVTAASGTAGLAGSGAAAATFHANDSTFALHVIAIEAALRSATHTAGEAAHWQEGLDAYIFITDGVTGVGANDLIVKLVGIDTTAATLDVLTIASNNLTLA